MVKSTPGGIRTPNLLIRNQVLYPVELQALFFTGRFYTSVAVTPQVENNINLHFETRSSVYFFPPIHCFTQMINCPPAVA
jgi:hypothetical protein